VWKKKRRQKKDAIIVDGKRLTGFANALGIVVIYQPAKMML